MGRQWGAAGFVGRSFELAVLREAWRSIDGGQPRWILVGGEAGIGKTRLVTEFACEVPAQGARVVVGYVSRLLEKLQFNTRVQIALLAHNAGEAET